MDLERAASRLAGFCGRRWWLRRMEERILGMALRRGWTGLVRENARRLHARAHHLKLTGADPRDAAEAALDHFEHLARLGDPEAALQVAEAHRTGFGRPRNHWKALDQYRAAAALGHPLAESRLARLEAGEPLEDLGEGIGLRALLKATYGPGEAERRARRTAEGLREVWREGIGLRATLAILGAAGLLLGYMALDMYFFGMGHWRPDPARVAWGLFGKIHPPRDATAGRALPGWLRPDARSVEFDLADNTHGIYGRFRIDQFQGRVVVLHVIDGRHPMVHESVAYFAALASGREPGVAFFLLYDPGLEKVADALFGIEWATDVAPALPASPRALRPLGPLKTYPMTFVLDRKGRIRQRWPGFSEALTEEAIRSALAES